MNGPTSGATADPTGTPEGATPVTEVTESDPSADSVDPTAEHDSGMGVSSERAGSIRGVDRGVRYDEAPTHTDEAPDTGDDGEPLPEQSARDGRPEVHPDPVGTHDHDSDRNPRHGV